MFLAVARTGGLAPAARSLGVNQSTVFRRMAQLEERLGTRLFDREPRGYALTSAGELMHAHALRLEDDVLALERALVGADQEPSGTVVITTVDEVLEAIAPYIRRFSASHPAIELHFDTALRVFSLSRREADVAIRPGTKPTEPDVVGRRLVDLSMAAYASAEYLEGRKRVRRIADLAKHDIIRFVEGPKRGLHPAIDGANTACRTTSMNAQTIAARAGLGVAILPTFIGEHDPSLERLVRVPTPDDYALWVLIHADLRQTARVRAFVDELTAAIHDDQARWRR